MRLETMAAEVNGKRREVRHIFCIALLVIPIVCTLSVTTSCTRSESTDSEWLPAGGHLWSGVWLYYGANPSKMIVGQVLGGNDKYVDRHTSQAFRGIKLRMQSGSEEWKDRGAIVVDGRWFVRRNDPALETQGWEVCQY